MTADLLDVKIVVEGDSITAQLKGSAEGEAVKTLESALSAIHAKLKETSATTAILGLLPLLVLRLHGTEIERPLAIVMIGGLVTSTLFTLLALPTFYELVHRLQTRFGANNRVS